MRGFVSRWGTPVALLLLAALAFGMTYLSPITYAISDPHLSLLVSQAILEEGTIKLDAYRERAEPPLDSYPPSGPLARYDDHLYYYFPLGPSLLALPVVATARGAGLDMAQQADNHFLQNLLSALT